VHYPTQHQLDSLLIACPSVMVFTEPTWRKPARGDGLRLFTCSSAGRELDLSRDPLSGTGSGEVGDGEVNSVAFIIAEASC